jgi:anti-sigma B factor antagonist
VSLILTPMSIGDVTIVEVTGRITLGESVAHVRQQIHALADQGRKKILLNLANVTYIDSTGIGELVSAYTTLKSQGGAVKLLKLTKRVHDVLQITKLSTVFEVYDDEARAVRSFGE